MESSLSDSSIHSLDSRRVVSHGSLLDFPKDPILCMRNLFNRHGDLAVLQDGPQKLVFVFGPQWNQLVLNDSTRFHSQFFAIRGPRTSAQRRLTSGLLSMNGQKHKDQRRLVMAPFQKLAVGQHLAPVGRQTAEMLETWRLGETRDINLEMTQFMRRVTSSLLFGVEQTELAYAIGEMIDDWVRLNHETGMGALISDPSFTEGYDQLLHMAEQLERALQKMIELKRGQGGLGHDVLSLLLGAHDEGSKLTDAELVGHAALLFGAAHLTTANTLSWTLFLLAEHPLIMQEVGREIRTKVSGESPALEEIPQLKVLDRVIKESMRILPASAYLQRMCAEEVQLGPISLPRGTMVVFSQFMTHRIPELYPEPDLFQPDRWLDLSPSPFAYFPFGAGARMCLGASLAMMTLKTTLPTILKRYRLMMSPNCEVNGSVISTMLSPTGPLQMEIHPVDCQFEARPVTGNIHDLVRLSGVSDSAGKSSRIAA
jgi:cytochrome P450